MAELQPPLPARRAAGLRLARLGLAAGLAGLGGGALPWLGGCSSTAMAPRRASASEQPQAVAPGVFLLQGAGGEIGPENLGRIGNIAFIVGPRGVLVVNCGVSLRQGQAALAAIRRHTSQPIRQLLLTHVRQEFLFGAAAFQDQGIPVLMHPAAARLMAARCETCLKALVRALGAEEMQGSRVVKPEQLLDLRDPDAPTGLADIGRPVRLLAAGPGGHSSGPGDVAVLDDSSQCLIAGGWLDAQSIPDVQDADFAGWRQALARVDALRPRHIVPGHGPAADAGLVPQNLRYLAQLEARTAELLQAGVALSDVPDRCSLPEFASWDQYDNIHRRNAALVFLRQERAMMLRP